MTTLYCDLETFSEADLKKTGSHAYAAHPSSKVLLWGYAVNEEPAKVWDLTQSEEMPEDLKRAIELVVEGKAVQVWQNGAMFDQVFLHYTADKFRESELIRKLASSPLEDTMILANQSALPGSLSALCKAFKLPEDKAKDADGLRLIQKFCRPTVSGKVRDRMTDPEDWDRFVNYCRLDIVSMREVCHRIPRFNSTRKEKALQELDVRINRRGICMDTDLMKSAIAAAEKNREALNAEIQKLTGGKVSSAQQRDALLRFIREDLGFPIEDLAKATVERHLKDEKTPQNVKRILTLRQKTAKNSIAKFTRLRDALTDGRLRGSLQFRGASRTGRYCLTGDHEVLTEAGWVRLDEWAGGRIAVWNKESEALSFQEAEALAFDYEGDMYMYDTVRCAQLSTPDHRMAYLGKSGHWEVTTVENLSRISRPKIPFTGIRKQPSTMEHDLLRVLIMTQADGRYTPDGQVVYNFKKLRKVQRCKSLLRKVGVPFIMDTYESGVIRIAVYARNVPLWLRLFKGKEYGYWLLNESPDVIFDELPEWDGYRSGPNSIQYCTKSRHNADLIQALACLSGRTATISIKKPQKEHWAECYVVNIWSTPKQGHELREKPRKIQNWKGRVYCARTTTGFFLVRRDGRVWVTGNSGKIFQPHNLPRPKMETDEIEWAVEAVKGGYAHLIWDNVGEVLSDCLRGLIIAPKGKKLCVADYSNIEGRVLAWLAGEEWKLKAFRDKDAGIGQDLYKLTYGKTFGIRPEDVTKKQRQMGKVLELAMGYQGGPGAFVTFADGYSLDLDTLAAEIRSAIPTFFWDKSCELYDWTNRKEPVEMKAENWIAFNAVKEAWRAANPSIVRFWSDVGNAAVEAIKNEGAVVRANKRIAMRSLGGYLLIRLPSGRFLSYPSPRLPAKGERCDLTYADLNERLRRWERTPTYAGKIAENITQAVACDILMEAGLRLEKAGYEIVLSVHDEYICEVCDDETRNHRQMAGIMSELPTWAEGLPLSAEGFDAYRYRK